MSTRHDYSQLVRSPDPPSPLSHFPFIAKGFRVLPTADVVDNCISRPWRRVYRNKQCWDEHDAPVRQDSVLHPPTLRLRTAYDRSSQASHHLTGRSQTTEMNGLPGLGYYGQQYQAPDSRRSIDGYAQGGNMALTGPSSTANGIANGGQSLDEIIHQNNLEMMRRRTYQQPQFRPPNPENHARRSSMLEFGAPISADLANFQFDPNPAPSILPTSTGDMTAAQKSLDPRKVRSREDLNVNTRFAPMDSTYSPYPTASSYSPALMSGVSMNLEPQYMPQTMDLSMDYDNASGEVTPMNLHPSHTQQPMFTDSPLDHNFPLTYPDPSRDPAEVDGRSEDHALMERAAHMNMPEPIHSRPVGQDISGPSPVSTSQVQNIAGMGSPAQVRQQDAQQVSPSEQNSNSSK
jgi:hypothetical protein